VGFDSMSYSLNRWTSRSPLNLLPFAALPSGKGYMVEHGPVIHMLTSERDLVPTESTQKKSGLLAIGSPLFELAANSARPSPLRNASAPCEEFRKLEFHSLPGSGAEVADLNVAWRRWKGNEPFTLLTGADATRNRFIEEASRNGVLHVATHAFVLGSGCGDGNPLLHSGLVFAGANESFDSAILTAQQISSLDLSGVDWAVLSACNTGNGELRDGEGVLGLERAFRIAGVRSVVMTLWPIDDDLARRFMHELYAQRFGHGASAAHAVWGSARKLLQERRAAGKSTHPWYWAGFVASGGWE
jgi:CHAT domain-containing protein